MISFDDIKPGKLLVLGEMLIGKRTTIQINSYPQELETEFTVEIIREEKFSYSNKYRNIKKQRIYLTRKDLLKNNKNQSLIGWRKPRINEIFDWNNLKFVNKMNP